jgi:hypothetical protein
MKRVRVFAAALPAAVGLAAPAAAVAATTPATHGKKVAYPLRSHHQHVTRNALASSSASSSASGSRPVISRSASLPASPGALPRSAMVCHTGMPEDSCMSVSGNGQHLGTITLSYWPNAAGGTRTGFISYQNTVTHKKYPDFRTRTKSEPKHTSYSFTWVTNCHVSDPGLLIGHVGRHPGRELIHIHSGTLTGKMCSGTQNS